MLSQMFRAAYGRGAAPSGEVRLALEAADIPSFWRSIHEAQSELRRCRRYEHPLAVLVVGVESAGLRTLARTEGHDADAEAWFLRRFECAALLVLGWILRDATREIDSVSYAAENHTYVIVLPETDANGAKVAARRLSSLFEKRSSVSLSVGVAAFPADGLTVEDLFYQACSVLSDAKSPSSEQVEEPEMAAGGGGPAPSRTAASPPALKSAGANGAVSFTPAASASPSTAAPLHAGSPTTAPAEDSEPRTPARRAKDLPAISPSSRQHGSDRVTRRASNG